MNLEIILEEIEIQSLGRDAGHLVPKHYLLGLLPCCVFRPFTCEIGLGVEWTDIS